MTPEAFAARFGVPRGTIEQLGRYESLLREWQGRMNLVAPSTLDQIWERHFADSAQLASLAPIGSRWLDIGAGGGFPGLVLAILGHGPVHLVESIGKKCAFLNAVVNDLNLADLAVIHRARVETVPPLKVDVITARACASLAQLFEWGLRHSAPRTIWILPKGGRHVDELREAYAAFDFEAELVPSITAEEARVIVARDVRRKRG